MLALAVILKMTKADFIAAMGGPSATVGSTTVTAEQLACKLEELLDTLTRPGSRVYPRNHNQDHFWSELVQLMEQQ